MGTSDATIVFMVLVCFVDYKAKSGSFTRDSKTNCASAPVSLCASPAASGVPRLKFVREGCRRVPELASGGPLALFGGVNPCDSPGDAVAVSAGTGAEIRLSGAWPQLMKSHVDFRECTKNARANYFYQPPES